MKTTTKFRNNRIGILFSLTTLIALPLVNKAQINFYSSGGVSISGGSAPVNGLLIYKGNINLNADTNSYQIGGSKVLWHNHNTTNIFAGIGAGNSSAYGSNSAFGSSALAAITVGTNNTACGNMALMNHTTGVTNTGMGDHALYSNTTGNNNTACGGGALPSNTTGTGNTACGFNAGYNNTSGTYNTFIGYSAQPVDVGSTNATAIGFGAIVNASNKIRLGNSSVTVVEGPVAYTTSDVRFKSNIKEDVKGLEFIKKLRPVTYNFDTKKYDDFLTKNLPDSMKTKHQKGMDFATSTQLVHSGFIAQEVERAAHDAGYKSSIVHAPVDENDNYSIAYGNMVVPLVKAVQELSSMMDNATIVKSKQDSVINAQNAKIQSLQTQLSQLAASINSCCNTNGGVKTRSSNDSASNHITVNLQNVQTVILSQNHPNPFAQQTTINYALPATVVTAQMLFYNMQGQLIQTVELTQRGNASIIVFGQDLISGNYTYTLVADGQIMDSKKMVKQ